MKTIGRIFFSIALSLMIICGVVKLCVSFKQIYYFDIDYLKIPQSTMMTKEDIKLNYDYLIDYNMKHNIDKNFKLPTLPSSTNGKIHFQEVRDIFQAINYIFYISIIISIIGILISSKNKDYKFLNYSSNIITILPLSLLALISINFQKSFIIFHRLLFRNDYWIFDPNIDPVINILPEQFFFHEGIFILVMIVISSLLLKLIYRKIKRIN